MLEKFKLIKHNKNDRNMFANTEKLKQDVYLNNIENKEKINEIIDYLINPNKEFEKLIEDYSSKLVAETSNINFAANPQLLIRIGNVVICRINFNLAKDSSNFDTNNLVKIPDELAPATNCRITYNSNYSNGSAMIYLNAAQSWIRVDNYSENRFGTSGTQMALTGIWQI